MSKSLTLLIAEVRWELGNPDTTGVPDSQITSRINDSYIEIATRFRHPETDTEVNFSSAASDYDYAVQSNFWYTESLKDTTNSVRLHYRPIEWIESQPEIEGLPTHYTLRASNIILYPTPNSINVYRHRYVKHVTPLSSGSNETITNDAWDEIIKWGAVWRCFQMLREQDAMVHTRNIWRTLVNSMPETDNMERERSNEFISPITDNTAQGPWS